VALSELHEVHQNAVLTLWTSRCAPPCDAFPNSPLLALAAFDNAMLKNLPVAKQPLVPRAGIDVRGGQRGMAQPAHLVFVRCPRKRDIKQRARLLAAIRQPTMAYTIVKQQRLPSFSKDDHRLLLVFEVI
jgi:hypothetical protein